MIELQHVRKEYAEATPLKDVNAIINQGDVISVIGPSGTGKSTLLRCINMLDPPTSGKIIVDGVTITDPGCDLTLIRRKLGMVFQSFNLFNHLTVIENLMVPQIDLLSRSRQEAFDKGMELLKRVGMATRYLQYPEQLSGGQKQRVAIARTLTMDPEIILFDEPTSALDPTMVGEVESVIKDLAADGTTMMIVTHEMRFAREICNRVFYMDQGGIYDDGTPEQIFDNPQRENTRRFIRHLKTHTVEIDSFDYDFKETSAGIVKYCYKNNVLPRDTIAVSLSFEELCQQLLLPAMLKNGIQPKIRFTFEYEPDTKIMQAEVLCNGKIYDFSKDEDSISYKMFSSAVHDFVQSEINEDGYTVRMQFKIYLGRN